MDIKLKLMYLGSRVGKNDDGTEYYQGQFLEKTSNQVVRLYFPNNTKLLTFKPYTDYEIEATLYINTKGLWAIRVK